MAFCGSGSVKPSLVRHAASITLATPTSTQTSASASSAVTATAVPSASFTSSPLAASTFSASA